MEKRASIKQVVVRELEVQYERPPFSEMIWISSSRDCENLFRSVMDPNTIDYKEFFWAAFLNRAHRVLGVSMIGMGSRSECTVNMIEIFQLAINTNSSGIVLCHNHPSGSLKPSQSDISLTAKVKEGCRLFDISLLDHIILTKEGYYSFVDEGVM